ncbi:hypothetical protein NEIELOOT_02914 [Neisseria elongata subsp. glycolytica ATCC 29315]|uniref:Uncharacterized protein n=1 Tax=Neisseria elongata subsp. glycolytica ATCC 29315 TaxID=546263 RepID=D4DV02_NEIEG|nr:hypothetical protein NEIELOOT_02914 [Neisseria elongata subsp. glycolytica ATCC 29315]
MIDEEHPETHDELYAKYIRIVEENKILKQSVVLKFIFLTVFRLTKF